MVGLVGDAAENPSIDYMGQTTPGLEPQIFATGVISTSARELNSVFSPDGGLFLFTRRDTSQTYRIMEINTSATDYCPKVSPDGRFLFYTSRSTGEGDVYWVDARILDRYRPGKR